MDGLTVRNIRVMLKMEKTEFAKLLNVDLRTVTKWEENRATPNASCEGVLLGLREVLVAYPNKVTEIRDYVRSASNVGGLPYLIIRLFQDSIKINATGNG